MLLLTLFGFAGWPIAAFVRSRGRHQPTLIAVRSAAFALFANLLVGIPLVDTWFMRRETNSAETGTTVVFALIVVWGCAPYAGILIWLIRRLFTANTRHT
jgi:hypothetical protein